MNTLGTLSDALDLAPGHIIRAASTLVHSPAPTILTFLSTLSLGLFLAFAPALPDIGIVRRLFDDAYPSSAADLERGVARRLGCRVAGGRNVDLAIWAPLAACLICLSAAWMAGYIRGIRRSDVAPTLQSTRLVISTEHPRYLETFGALLLAAGVGLAWALIASARRRAARDRAAPPARGLAHRWYGRIWRVAVFVGIGFIVNRGFIAYGAKQGLTLTVVAHGATITGLGLDPAIRVSVGCSSPPCGITRAALQRGKTDFEGLADVGAVGDRGLDLFEIDQQAPATGPRVTDAASALADLGLPGRPEARSVKRYPFRHSAMSCTAGAPTFRACTLRLNNRDLQTVVAEVRRSRIFRDGTVFLPLKLRLGTGERRDAIALRVFVPVKSA